MFVKSLKTILCQSKMKPSAMKLLFKYLLIFCRCNKSHFCNSHSNIISKCVNKIVAEFALPDSVIYVIDTNLQIPYPIIYQNSSIGRLKLFKFHPPDIYIIQLGAKNMNQMLTFLDKSETFNSRAKFVILSDSPIEEIFQNLSRFFVYNSVVVQSDGNLVTYHPFRYEDATGANASPVILGHCTTLKVSNLFNTKLPSLWRNTTISSVYYNVYPFLYTDKGKLYGTAHENLKLIQQMLKFKLFKRLSKTGPFGLAKINGTYTSMLG
jgi:hypothetical protein